MLGTSEKIIKKFNATARTFELQLKEKEMDPETYIKTTFEQIVDDLVKIDSNPVDQAGITITNGQQNDRPIFVSFRSCEQITAQVILNEFEKVIQSNATFIAGEPLKIFVTKVKMPQGRGKDYKNFENLKYREFCERKSSIITIKNDDNLCLPRALEVGKLLTERKNDEKKFKALVRKEGDNLKEKAEKLCSDAGVTINKNGADLTTIREFQNYLKEYKITV